MSSVLAPHSIETVSGRFLDLADPHPDDVLLEDIAHGLANTCRYAGQSAVFYSVAEHACLVCDYLAARKSTPRVCLAGLHHDSHEAYLGDIPTPLKRLIPEFAGLERTVTAAIEVALDLPALALIAATDVVKTADRWALATEARELMPSQGEGWTDAHLLLPPPADGEFDDGTWWGPLGWTPIEAKASFLARHTELVAVTPRAAA